MPESESLIPTALLFTGSAVFFVAKWESETNDL